MNTNDELFTDSLETIIGSISDPTLNIVFRPNLSVVLINGEIKWWQQIIQPIANFKKYYKYFNFKDSTTVYNKNNDLVATIMYNKKSTFDVQEIAYFGLSDMFAQFGGTYASTQLVFGIILVLTSANYFSKKLHKI